MRRIAILLPLLLASAGTVFAQQPPRIGMPNPASQYCVELGGRLEIRNDTGGQVGYCHLPDGRVVEEWALFRSRAAKP